MNKLLNFLLVAILLTALIVPMACSHTEEENKDNVNATGEFSYATNAEMSSTDYNKNLYYLNELKFEIADPSVIYIDHGEEEGWFYAYGTSDLVSCYGIQCWRSKDLTNWEYKSVAYQPDFGYCWDYSNHWAPEVIYDEALEEYLMFFNADYTAKGGRKYMDVVHSKNPYGPFVTYSITTPSEPSYDFTPSNKSIAPELAREYTIDIHPYVDPVSGDKYLYYSGYGKDGNGVSHGQTIFGVKLKNWKDPDYSTLTELTKLYNTTVDRDDDDIDEGKGSASVNEAPYVIYNDGTYYLTFSVYAYDQEMYQVRTAVADSPLGPYTKIKPEDGGQVIATDTAWSGIISSAGHHCFIKCGDQLMIAYHTFLNRVGIDNGRALAVDTVSFVDNGKGQTVIHANGPTYSYQPLPKEISGYGNVASQATVTASNTAEDSDISYLTDGLVKIHEIDPVKEFVTKGDNTVITLEFENFVNVRSILLYNSIHYEQAFWGINSIKLHYKSGADTTGVATVRNVLLDTDWNVDTFSEVVYPGTNSIVEFDELPVNKIEITINAKDAIALNEIVVLGRRVAAPKAVTAFKDYTYDEPQIGDPLPVYESNTFGTAGPYKSSYGYDLTHDDGTENAYVDKTWCGNLQLLFFKDVCSTDFYVEAELSVLDRTKSYMNDKYPKIGIMMKSVSDYFVFFNIDCQEGYNGQYVGWVESNDAGTDYMWSNYKTKFVCPIGYTGENYTKLAIARRGSTCWMFVNDKLAFKEELKGFTDNSNTAAAVSFLTYNSFTRFRNYSITANIAEVDGKLAELGVSN